MANKFLPFVVEKSTPIHIYTTLLSRSKGMNYGLVAAVFDLVLTEGIADVRKYVNTMPDMPLQKLYEELISHYSKYRVDNDRLQMYLGFAPFIASEDANRISDELSELETIDALLFFMVTVKHDTFSEYCQIPFKEMEEQRFNILTNLPDHISFADSGELMEFRDAYQLQAFILYNAVLSESPITSKIRVVFKNRETA
jgi:hypothetical protein